MRARPSAQTAGSSFNVTVNAVDANWNPVSSTDTVGITSTDANATLPANAALVAGTKTFSVTPKTTSAEHTTAPQSHFNPVCRLLPPTTTTTAGASPQLPT